MDDIKLNNEERKFLGLMSEEQFNHYVEVLGPKVINSIMRMSRKDLSQFESKIKAEIEKNQDKTKSWYKPGIWQEV